MEILEPEMEIARDIATIVVIIVVVGVLTALPVMLLWNWLVPAIFGLPAVTFWQALGICILVRLLAYPATDSK